MGTNNNNTEKIIHYELETGALNIDSSTLENMKLAMLAFFSQPEDEFPAQYLETRVFFKRELESAAVWIEDNSADIGVWNLENKNNQLFLVRYSEMVSGEIVSYNFHAGVELKKSGWEVVSFSDEREFGLE